MILLIAQSVVFALWVVLMVRTLVRLRVRAIAGPMPALTPTLPAWRDFLLLPAHRAERRLLAGVTLALFALSALHALRVS
jgi:hypothetical protein